MRQGVRRRGCVYVLLAGLTLGSLTSALAEPSAACRALAKQFAETPEKLNTDHLFRLQACIHRELGNRGADESTATPPPPLPKLPFVPGLPSRPGS